MNKRSIVLFGATLAAAPFVVSAGLFDDPDIPPDNAKSLSEVAKSIEARDDFMAFESIDYDDGAYEVEYYDKDGKEHELRIDPLTGKEQQ